MKRQHFSMTAFALLLFLVLSGCGATDGDEHAGHTGHTALPDNIETTASVEVLPSFLDNFTETTQNFYSQVNAHEAILRELNCYCGCMEYNDPHDSLYRCFIVGIDDGGVHWTDHGSSCGICLMELRDAIKLADEGKTLDDIQHHIDKTYGGTAPTM